ncbi:RHS repeat-associated core domain-containing protein, partial [Anoxybacteroides rupiense]|uniref:RHS repeat-associated core domain-containing protein n=1 Tax=Anoxybacteroides rupiense TaxID=311460 RepID=UPI00366D142A
LYYLQARYYDPETARFISRDPDPGDKDDPITQNAYTYANDNPVMYKDPNGHYRISVKWFAAGLNAGLSMVLTGGLTLGALIAYIKKKGTQAAKRIFYRTLRDKLIVIGASAGILKSLEWVVNTAFNYLDPGTVVANWIDSRDKKPQNGYIDF